MPARAGVDDTKTVPGTETVIKGKDGKEYRIFMGDQNEVMLKEKAEGSGAWHRRWYPDGIKEIILNSESIGEDAVLRLSDNKDRRTLIKRTGTEVRFYDSVGAAIDDNPMMAVPWTKLKTAWRKAAGLKGRL
jgi:hypothetical protein